MSVSDSLVYRPKPPSIAGTTHRQSVPSYNGSRFTDGQTILINIPCGRRGHYLNTRMSYLRFRITNTSPQVVSPTGGTGVSASFNLDYTGSSFIQSLSLFHGSNLLEQIHEYNALYHFMLDMQGSEESVCRAATILEGADEGQCRRGKDLTGGQSVYVTVPVMSGIVGPLQGKYLPTGAMTGGDLRLELTLAPTARAVKFGQGTAAQTGTWAIDDVELALEYVEVSSEVDRMIQQANPRYVISFESYANYTNTVSKTEGQINKLIPARFSSLKTLYTFFRQSDILNNRVASSVTTRVNPQISNWYYQVSGENIPATPVREDIEAFAELMKALHSFGSADNTTVIKLSNWKETDGEGVDYNKKAAFAIGQNLETLSHKSTLTESGKGTLNTNCYLLGSVAGEKDLHISTFAHYDGVLVIENGVATSAF